MGKPAKPCTCGHGKSYHLVRCGCVDCKCEEFMPVGYEVNKFG